MTRCGRNDPCPCGSGKKYKKCCGQKKSLTQRSFSQLTASVTKGGIDRLRSKMISAIQPQQERELGQRVTTGSLPKKEENQLQGEKAPSDREDQPNPDH
ncbi:MAG: SEC-C metal-binding domain-containing protein [Chlamydiota bacterium]